MRPSWIASIAIAWCTWVAWSAPALALEDLEGPIKNGLSSQSFSRNALTTNPESLRILVSHALDNPALSATEATYLDQQFKDPRARAMLAEIVKCVVPGGTEVAYAGSQWQGELGLCALDPAATNQSAGPPAWGAGGPNPACQQLATACVMARVNALHRAIPLRLEGEPAALFPPRARVLAGTHFRESDPGQDPAEGLAIGSFGGPICIAGRECDWAPAYVGRCNATGGQIHLALQGTTCSATPVRVCAGIHGCLDPSSGYTPPHDALDDEDPAQALYWKELQPVSCTGSDVAFNCPIGFGGTYSVMTRPTRTSTGTIQPIRPPSPPLVQTAGTGIYSATSREVFTFREGAFYGNLFVPGELSWSCQMTDDTHRTCSPLAGTSGSVEVCGLSSTGTLATTCDRATTVPYRNVYACYSLAQQQDSQGAGADADGIAYLNDRICDEPHHDCFFHPPKRCFFADAQTNEDRGAHCQWTGDGAFHQCQSLDRTTSYLTITTYLNNACDLLDDADVCAATRRGLTGRGSPTTPGTTAGTVRPGHCGSCSLRDPAGGLILVPLIALLVLRRRVTAGPGARVARA